MNCCPHRLHSHEQNAPRVCRLKGVSYFYGAHQKWTTCAHQKWAIHPQHRAMLCPAVDGFSFQARAFHTVCAAFMRMNTLRWLAETVRVVVDFR